VTFDALEALYREVDAASASVAAHHAARLQCQRGCHDCCVDGLTVFALEAEHLVARHPAVFASEPGPAGGCALLDTEGACRVYADRPYVCRTQGLPLRWEDDGAEYRDICPLNEPGPELVELPTAQCFTLGPFEGRLAELQRQHGDGRMDRVPLRDLFRGSKPWP
jgi:hypothetical protein